MYDYIIVGAGFAGCTLAERLANGHDAKVLIVDQRSHIGGNAFDYYDNNGILVHKYGPHIFHTNSKKVFDYLSKFTKWRPYQHRVLASVDGQNVPIPINLDTVNQLYGLNLTSLELENWFEMNRKNLETISNAEDAVVSKVGKDLYEKFFRGYTEKQWGVDPKKLSAQVTARIPTRTNRDDRYFTDIYQAMPLHGYTRMFENMLDHPNIHIMLNTPYDEIRDEIVPVDGLIYTGPIDEYFMHYFGALPYRSLDFKFETHDVEQFQSTGTINYPNDYDYTRVTEFKHLTGQSHSKTTVVYEYPKADGDPYYPIPNDESQKLYKKYADRASLLPSVHFVGRLGTYKYYNMDQVVAQALSKFERL